MVTGAMSSEERKDNDALVYEIHDEVESNVELDLEASKDQSQDVVVVDEAFTNLPFSDRYVRSQNLSDRSIDRAESLVRTEANAVRIVRGAMITLLAVAATLTGIFTYRLSSRNHRDSFIRDFEDAAEAFIVSFKRGTGNQLYQTSTLSFAMSAGLYSGSKPTFPYVKIEDFESITSSLRLQAQADIVNWSPLLKNKKEKEAWEAYARRSLSNSQTSGQNPPCKLCGEGMEVSPGGTLVNPASGVKYSCTAVEAQALGGTFSASECTVAATVVAKSCGCRKSESSQVNATILDWKVSEGLYRLENGTAVAEKGTGPYSPISQVAPIQGGTPTIMFNQMSNPIRRKAIYAMLRTSAPVLSQTIDPQDDPLYRAAEIPGSASGVFATFFYPVFDSLDFNRTVGSLDVSFSWTVLFTTGLSSSSTRSEGAVIVLENTCGQVFTFKVVRKEVKFLGNRDLHDSAFDSLQKASSFEDFQFALSQTTPGKHRFQDIPTNVGCAYRVRVYPSNEFRMRYKSNEPWQLATVVVMVFLFTSCVFLLYDFIVRRIQAKMLSSAKRSEAIVSSLFPDVVRDRLFRDGSGQNNVQSSSNPPLPRMQLSDGLINHKTRLKSYLSHPPSVDIGRDPDPIADLFPNTTILFADIAGFTAWSSEREPSQVFKLLETLYSAFDQAAKELGVFKIETIGDCYVAVSGLPEPRKDHAVVMVKFAFECLVLVHDITRKLETTLGPGTADLNIRVGLHSGPVIAGVLRGERARFQLFGDTMNVASRMESTGKVSKVHLSKETAQLLVDAGKSDWVEMRDELVTVKGKGRLQTYWLKTSGHIKSDVRNRDTQPQNETNPLALGLSITENDDHNTSVWGAASLDTALALRTCPTERRNRLIAWNAELLQQFLQKVVVRRNVTTRGRHRRVIKSFLQESTENEELAVHVVDKITEIIKIPAFNERTAKEKTDPSMIDLGPVVRSQIWEFVSQVASMYRDNDFHNFEHASHVAMSASKLLKRIIAPDDVEYRADESGKKLKSRKILSKEIHDTTFGISSDPLMQFAAVFSAVIHDVDHTGLPNQQLVQSMDPLAIKYRNKCVAEQHSVRTAWKILMEDRYADFRRCIYQTDDDRERFCQFVINAVIATDIADKELQSWRKQRWDKAFHGNAATGGCVPLHDRTIIDRKATIVFEYIIQASDVAHTMQHWHIYQKWNQRLFKERYMAFIAGKDNEDPSLSWFEWELWFFDNYVIPLAQNLEECNVFGVSCDEYLSYALENRNEWALKGEQVVSEWSQLVEEELSQAMNQQTA